jgi:hypothetical protein
MTDGRSSGHDGPGPLIGFLATVGLAVLSFWVGTFVSRSGRYPPLVPVMFAFGIGLSQLVYVLPLHSWARHRGAGRFLRGLWSGAALVFVTNVALWLAALSTGARPR